jgi:mannose-1-phosphate guanylyltransferase/mannose-6-phosphate isomerase
MEETKKAATVPLDAGWSDHGSWSSLWSSMGKCKKINASLGDVVLEQSQNCLSISEHRFVTVLGLKDLIVVEMADSVLIADLEHVQDIKKVVQKLKSGHRTEASEHCQEFRPRGMYDCIDKGYRFQVKRITVKSGETLSLQMHHHTAEHWVVVSGTATVRCGDKTTLLTENQSTYIPLGERHRLSNPGKVDLELIEVQPGSYLGEDDIEKFEDHFGR